jgi:hypothetical protein
MIVFCERRMTDHMREDLALSGIAEHSYLLNRANVYVCVYILCGSVFAVATVVPTRLRFMEHRWNIEKRNKMSSENQKKLKYFIGRTIDE